MDFYVRQLTLGRLTYSIEELTEHAEIAADVGRAAGIEAPILRYIGERIAPLKNVTADVLR